MADTVEPRTEAGRALAAFVDAIKPFGSNERVLSESMVRRITGEIGRAEREAVNAERARAVALVDAFIFDLSIGNDVTYSRGCSAGLAAAREALRVALLETP